MNAAIDCRSALTLAIVVALVRPAAADWSRWLPTGVEFTVRWLLLHHLEESARHAGHADIMREQHDTTVGLGRNNSNIPDDYDWPAYVSKLTKLADHFG